MVIETARSMSKPKALWEWLMESMQHGSQGETGETGGASAYHSVSGASPTSSGATVPQPE